ncbi:DUF6082 family protein [Streptomyces griseofuscus]|uniref:DUF6082 family protein n=1 Tax=Streptomyces griseofuscus TaxID=146922 RepID=UPI0036A3EFD2
MKNGPVIALAIVAVGSVHIAQRRRHHQEYKRLHFAQWHSQMVGETANNPDALADNYTDIQEQDRATVLRQNRWAAMWSTMLRLGYMDEPHFRKVATEFMGEEPGRTYWAAAREHRWATASDNHDRRFNSLMDDAYAKTRKAEPEPDAA